MNNLQELLEYIQNKISEQEQKILFEENVDTEDTEYVNVLRYMRDILELHINKGQPFGFRPARKLDQD